jgi:uncharacterized NAD(P)/FAD-binding protein YdhS
MSRIAIIGAGLSGRLLALNMLRLASSDAVGSVRMLDRGDERDMGPAYSYEADYLLLNVPAGRMGAFSEDPEHFLRWNRDRGAHAGPWDFLPRRLYRDYILALVREALQARAGGTTLEYVRGEVTDIDTEGGCPTIHVEDKGPIVVDKAVLALGNFPPRHPPIENRSALESERYIRNPWDPSVLDCLSRRDTVFLIGTGQTTVDLVVALHRRAHEGRIIALSRRGLLPLAYSGFDPYESFFEEIKESKTILNTFRIVRKHLDRAESMGIDKRAVIDSLRPDTQAIWLGLLEDEKRRFLRHLFRYWEITRSRIPPESKAIIDAMRASGQLDVLAGRICDLAESEAAIDVHYANRGRTRHEVAAAALVINCIGPESDYRRIDHPLVRNLMRRGLIRPGPAHLGVDALLNGAIIGQNGAASDVLYTLGSTMKGVLWEVVAVPEIRVQAKRLARLLFDGDHRRRDASSAHAR